MARACQGKKKGPAGGERSEGRGLKDFMVEQRPGRKPEVTLHAQMGNATEKGEKTDRTLAEGVEGHRRVFPSLLPRKRTSGRGTTEQNPRYGRSKLPEKVPENGGTPSNAK